MVVEGGGSPKGREALGAGEGEGRREGEVCVSVCVSVVVVVVVCVSVRDAPEVVVVVGGVVLCVSVLGAPEVVVVVVGCVSAGGPPEVVVVVEVCVCVSVRDVPEVSCVGSGVVFSGGVFKVRGGGVARGGDKTGDKGREGVCVGGWEKSGGSSSGIGPSKTQGNFVRNSRRTTHRSRTHRRGFMTRTAMRSHPLGIREEEERGEGTRGERSGVERES